MEVPQYSIHSSNSTLFVKSTIFVRSWYRIDVGDEPSVTARIRVRILMHRDLTSLMDAIDPLRLIVVAVFLRCASGISMVASMDESFSCTRSVLIALVFR